MIHLPATWYTQIHILDHSDCSEEKQTEPARGGEGNWVGGYLQLPVASADGSLGDG